MGAAAAGRTVGAGTGSLWGTADTFGGAGAASLTARPWNRERLPPNSEKAPALADPGAGCALSPLAAKPFGGANTPGFGETDDFTGDEVHGACEGEVEPIGAAGCCCTLGCASPFATDTGAAVNTYEAGCKGA